MNATEIEQILGNPVEQLIAGPVEVGLEILGAENAPLGAFPRQPSEYVRAGRQWLEDRRIAICEALRKHPTIAEYVRGGSNYKLAQIAAIVADILMITFSIKMAGAAWGAVTLLHLGLDQFCGGLCQLPQGGEPAP